MESAGVKISRASNERYLIGKRFMIISTKVDAIARKLLRASYICIAYLNAATAFVLFNFIVTFADHF